MELTRRDLLRFGIVAGGTSLLSGARHLLRADELPPSPVTTPFVTELILGRGIPYFATPVTRFTTKADPADCVNPDGSHAFHVHGPRDVPDNTEFFEVHEREVVHSFHPELPLNSVWAYDGQIPGPTFVGRTGTPQLVRFVNDLPENDPVGIGEPISCIHRHGGFQAPEDDGYPLDTFCIGQSRDYFFPNRTATGELQCEHSTLWYHDHAIDITGENVYRGLAGFYVRQNILDTGNEQDPSPNLGLPSGEYDIPLMIQDKQFDEDGYLVFDNFDHDGFLGDKFLVNGLIQPFLTVKRRKYRFRICNGSNARIYQFFLSTGQGQPFVAIATDSTLLEYPVPVQSFRIAPAERVEVVIDFSNYPTNQEIFLVNRLRMTDGRKPDGLVSPGTRILKFVVSGAADDPSQVPATLLPVTEGRAELLPRVTVQRRFKFERSHGAWVINGQFFDENRINAFPKMGEPEIWILESGGGWVHPVHIHLSEFFVLSRDGHAPSALERAGRKDTLQIGADMGREVKILIKFDGFTGRYAFHCHNIEHEDMRMMGQFEVRP